MRALGDVNRLRSFDYFRSDQEHSANAELGDPVERTSPSADLSPTLTSSRHLAPHSSITTFQRYSYQLYSTLWYSNTLKSERSR